MDLVLNFGALSLVLVTGASFLFRFVDFLRARALRARDYHGDSFSADPKRTDPWKSRRSRRRNTNSVLCEPLRRHEVRGFYRGGKTLGERNVERQEL
jgi:hypothetical protein